MGFIVPPNLSSVTRDGKSEDILNFVYNFLGDTPMPIQIPGFSGVSGSQFNVNPASLNLNKTLKPFRSMLFSMEFVQDAAGSPLVYQPDGDFILYISSTGSIVRIPQPAINNQQSTTLAPNLMNGLVAGCIPIVCSDNPVFTFFKGSSLVTNLTYGKLTCSLFTFENPRYIISGYGDTSIIGG